MIDSSSQSAPEAEPNANSAPPAPKATSGSFFEHSLNGFQAWALERPDNPLSRSILPVIGFVEGLLANQPTYLDAKRLAFGDSFCCAGQVVMGEFGAVETALTSPQARTWRLGTTMLEAQHAPNLDVGGRNLFLLSLSDEAAGGSGDREAFRACMETYLLGDAAIARQQDETARQLLDQLAADYVEMNHDPGGDFFTDTSRGLLRFFIRYLHYVLFGLDPDDKASMDLLADLHYDRQGTIYYSAIVSNILLALNRNGFRQVPASIEQVATLYENSPALANFESDNPDFKHMTSRELAKLMVAIMSIAGLQGPLHLAYTSMGHRPLPDYTGRSTKDIDPTHYWDKLDLDDRDALRLYLLECGRLWAPVSASHRVATEPFTLKVAGKERTFPAGTKVLIPMSLGLLSQDFWGPTTYEFNAERENLCPYHMGFHSVGDRSAGRICPGKTIALEMLIDILSVVGKTRRTAPPPETTP
ncbi:hypothetical protein [Synechococcus sp. PCC 7336]|uniref:hypothetical protein n=1 Tax=Synechococcus sp. PCC 7336 TaxID=195250 RepID=UPI00034A1A8D|nr:hypothetical protein [Synechococcus sp. PCC 7336]